MSISIKEYFALTGSRFSNDDARVIGPVLQEIAATGDVTPDAVVQAAHSTNSPLRPFFEWDDQKAAHQYRVGQARAMIESVRVRFVSGDREFSTRAYKVVTKRYEPHHDYWRDEEKIGEIIRPPNDEILVALRELDAWRTKYARLATFQSGKTFVMPILNQISEFREEVQAIGPIGPVEAMLGELSEWETKYGNEKLIDAAASLGEQVEFMIQAINSAWDAFGKFKNNPHLRRSFVEEENEELRERIRQLEEAQNGIEMLPPELELTASEERVVSALLNRDVMSKQAISMALYSDRPDAAPEIKIVDVFICKIRAKIEPQGLKIDTHWGRGYSMPPESKAELRGMIEVRKAAAA